MTLDPWHFGVRLAVLLSSHRASKELRAQFPTRRQPDGVDPRVPQPVEVDGVRVAARNRRRARNHQQTGQPLKRAAQRMGQCLIGKMRYI